MDLGLADRVYVITGGSKGLGFATAQALVADGAKVVLSSRSAEHVKAAVALLGEDHAAGVAGDNADEELPARLVATAKERFGRLDGLMVSVGGPPPGGALDTTLEQWRSSFESVFLGTLRLVRTIVPELGDGGAVALVLSTSVREPLPNLAISNGLRPGLAMTAKSLAFELAPRGIRVVSLLPGAIATDRMTDLLGDDDAAAARAATIPSRRIGEPAEFGRVAAFVLSPAASYLTGTIISVDGGAMHAL
jgi:3-oxoacyl-[acyl-carrier protein] reductase